MKKKYLIFFLLFGIILTGVLVAQQNNENKTTTDNKTTTETNKTDDSAAKGDTFGGKVIHSVPMYTESMDLVKFNARYYGTVVNVYSYFLERPNELTIVFQDYKKNIVILHLTRSNLYNLPNLYKDKLYEIRAKVGKVREGRLHMHFVDLKSTFLERTLDDQFIQ